MAKRETSSLGDTLGKIGGNIKDFANQATVFTGVVATAATVFGKQSVDAYNESAYAIKQTEAVLKSTAGVAGITSDQVTKLATSLQKQTTYSDESVRSAENLLLTFTNIGKDTFPQATETVLDMSTALGQDTKSSAIQLGKALQDPVLGITALRRVGVNFTDKQKDVIEHLVKTGDTLGAQKIILKELNTEFGGSAAAAADTYAGKIEILKNKFNDFQERIGAAITGLGVFLVTGDLTGEFLRAVGLDEDSPIIGFLVKFREEAIKLGDWIAANKELVINFLTGFAIALGALMIIGAINGLLIALFNPLTLVAVFVTALYMAWKTNFLGIRDIVSAVVTEVVAFFNDILMPFIQVLVDFWIEHWDTISAVLKGAWMLIVGIIQVAWALIYGILSVGLALLTGNWKQAWENIKHAAEIGWDGLTNIFNVGLSMLKNIGGKILDMLVSPFEDAWHRIQDLMNKIKDALDFTKRHSPSVVDIVNRGVGQVNRAMENLDFGVNAPVHAAAIGVSGGSAGTSIASIVVNLNDAIIGDDYGAQRLGEKLGDSIIKKLQMNLRF